MSTPPINPYAPSAIGESLPPPGTPPGAPTYKLFSVAAITLGGFLGAVISAAVLIAINFWRQGKQAAAVAMLGLGVVSMVVNFVLAMWLPEDSPDWPFWIAHPLISYALAAGTQLHALHEHQRRGGCFASVWWAVGISIVVGVLQAVLLLAIIEIVPDKYLGIE